MNALEEFNSAVASLTEEEIGEVLSFKIEGIEEDDLDPVAEREAIEALSNFYLKAKVERLSKEDREEYEEWLVTVTANASGDVPENPLTFFLDARAGRTWRQSVDKCFNKLALLR